LTLCVLFASNDEHIITIVHLRLFHI
jgi:hypothetical protein